MLVIGKVFSRVVVVGLLLGASLLSASVPVADAPEGPHAVVVGLTERVLTVVRGSRVLLESDPDAYFAAVGEVLGPIVAFDYIAKGVMGRFAQQATPEQRKRFSDIFQGDLISTYAKGLAAYADQEIRVVAPEGDVSTLSMVSVKQVVVAEGGEHLLVYKMGKKKASGEWKLLNVTLDGINLGSTFRSQFAQAEHLGQLLPGSLPASVEAGHCENHCKSSYRLSSYRSLPASDLSARPCLPGSSVYRLLSRYKRHQLFLD